MRVPAAALLLLAVTGCLPARLAPDPLREGPGPGAPPAIFRPELAPAGLLLHGGCFSPDQREFMYTVSDKEFRHFDVRTIRWNGTD